MNPSPCDGTSGEATTSRRDTDRRSAARQEWAWGSEGDWAKVSRRITYPSRADVLALAVHLSRPVPGHVMEFGSWRGHSTRVIRDELWRSAIWDRSARHKRIYACDSFRGLPTVYDGLPEGNFATAVPTLHGVRIVEGYFEDSLDEKLAQEVGRVSLAHLDADLYDSTQVALDWLTPLLGDGSLLLFDEFAGAEPAEEEAFLLWMERTGIETRLLAIFGREPSGRAPTSDRRALFQVVAREELPSPRPLWPARVRRRLLASR